MTYKLRDDIILEHVAGVYVLVALRSAWEECPFAIQIAPSMACLWNWIREGLPEEDLIRRLTAERGFPEEKAKKILSSFLRASEANHYLVKEA